MEEEVPPVTLDPADWRPISPAALPPEDDVAALCDGARRGAKRPLVVTSFVGRSAGGGAGTGEALPPARHRGAGIGAELR